MACCRVIMNKIANYYYIIICQWHLQMIFQTSEEQGSHCSPCLRFFPSNLSREDGREEVPQAGNGEHGLLGEDAPQVFCNKILR